jgi:double stranded RNA-specific editase B
VLASIVIKREVAYGNSRLCIVSLGAGSKAIDGRSLSKQGDRVHDCHAEILARRGMLRFLYAQLEKIKNGCQHQSIFVKNEGSEVYTIRDGVSFHLFISKPPCGDASVFGLHEFHPNRWNRGVARATPSNGEGAVYIPKDDKTFDDFKLGARLHKMCCSAKIARWNVIGIQGALLSLYVEPVYLSSITIGSDFNVSHMTRAVYGRVSKINYLPSCYQVKNPSLYKVQHSDTRKDKAHKMSLNWCLQHPKPSSCELIGCLEGTRFLGGASQLAKRELFKCFISLWDSLAPQALKKEASSMIGGEDVSHYPYDKVKDLADDYQWSKWNVGEHFILQQHYGSRWLKMPREVDQFSLREENRSNSEIERFRDLLCGSAHHMHAHFR